MVWTWDVLPQTCVSNAWFPSGGVILGGGGNFGRRGVAGQSGALGVWLWRLHLVPGLCLFCYTLLQPWCSAPVHGAKPSWTEPSATVSQNKSFFLLSSSRRYFGNGYVKVTNTEWNTTDFNIPFFYLPILLASYYL
jgi:hypothetical protein